jgi:CRP-like cAMP-binding protein
LNSHRAQPSVAWANITKGSATASLAGRNFRFEQGDTIGLDAIISGNHNHTYTAATDVTVFTYPCDSFETLDNLLKDKPDVAHLLANAMCRKLSDFLRFWSTLKLEADSAYTTMDDIYPQYLRLCNLYAFASKQLPGLTSIEAIDSGTVEGWMHEYYSEFKDLEANMQKTLFKIPGIASGFLRKGASDIIDVLQSCKELQEYLKNISKIYVSHDNHDLLSLITELHLNSMTIKGADAAVSGIMARFTGMLSGMTSISASSYQARLAEYTEKLKAHRGTKGVTELPNAERPKQNLADSMAIILEYSGMPEDTANVFARQVHEFTKIPDRASSDDDVYRLRRELTKIFYPVYQNVFTKHLKDPNPPTIIKMFLEFGYIDAALAGHANADYLYSIADSMHGDPKQGIYTIREWLTAIYKGQKEPSRDEFDLDWPAWLQDQKQIGEITAAEAARLLNDQDAKLKFELENVFPIANKMTFGRATSFCPLFHDQIQRKLEDALVTPAKIKEAFDEIDAIDPAAFHRPLIYENAELGVSKENVHVKIVPEIILMPNVGQRGAMWQDIEGRKRNTPGRVFAPIFLLIELKSLLMRITGEFRWEICKRIMGMRWNDLSDPSLTAEYCDYLQFYRSNRDLTAETKADIKLELTRAKNNYRTVFVNNYVEWLLYESNGSPRLTKTARKAMMMYCTFPAHIREKLTNNPQYVDPLKQWGIKNQQRVQQLTRIINRLVQNGKAVPKELADELEFAKQ